MNTKVNNLVTCKSCRWVSFEVSREYAETEVKKFNEYYDTLSIGDRELYYGSKKSSIEFYETCFKCNGSYKNFEEAKNFSRGSTVQPIINRNE